MATNLTEQITAKVALLPYKKQREVLRMIESLTQEVTPEWVSDSYTLPRLVTDEMERARLLSELVEEMQSHPFTGNPPRLTREELHERR